MFNILKFLVVAAIFSLPSCEQKKGHPTGGFSSINLGKRSTSGFGSKQQIPPDPLYLYLSGCYQGPIDGIDGKLTGGSAEPNLQLYIDARGLDNEGWPIPGSEDQIAIGITGSLSKAFNITGGKCVLFKNPTTYQVVEYWIDGTTRGANILLEISGLSNDGIEVSGDGTCKVYSHLIRIDLRLIFEDDNEGEPGPVNKMSGTYTIYYANIQKALIRMGDPRAENPDYCCDGWTGDPPSTCDEEVALDKYRDIAYVSGKIHMDLSADMSCMNMIAGCYNNQ